MKSTQQNVFFFVFVFFLISTVRCPKTGHTVISTVFSLLTSGWRCSATQWTSLAVETSPWRSNKDLNGITPKRLIRMPHLFCRSDNLKIYFAWGRRRRKGHNNILGMRQHCLCDAIFGFFYFWKILPRINHSRSWILKDINKPFKVLNEDVNESSSTSTLLIWILVNTVLNANSQN